MRVFLSILAVAALVLFGFSKPAQAQWQSGWPAGSWQFSCRNARLTGPNFFAQCTANNGAWVGSSINLNQCPSRQVGNSNGRLFCEGGRPGFGTNLPGGSWRQSCQNASMSGNVVRAACSTGRGFAQTSFNMRNCPGWALGNSNGRLFCENAGSGPGWGQPGHFPGGSWVNSCGNASLNGNVFRAMCSTGQRYVPTTIDLRSCRSRLVGNRNGRLFCEGG